MVWRTRSYAARLGVLAVAVGLVGCTQSGGGPVVTPSGSRTSTSTTSVSAPTTSPTGPTALPTAFPADVPAEARPNTPQGAVAFVKHFFATLNRAYTTPTAGIISPLSTSNCKSCATFETNSASYVAMGHRFDRPAVKLLEVSISPETPPVNAQIVDAVIDQMPAKIIDTTGQVVKEIQAKKGVLVLQVVRVQDVWFIDLVQVLE